ncbi:MAG: penicillin-binding protein 1A [Alphaproteobacteria bacterium]
MSLYWRIALVVVSLGFFALIVGAGAAVIYVSRMEAQLPDIESLKDYEPEVITRFHSGDGSLLAEYATERRLFVPVDDMPEHILHAFISAEDKNFYEHNGLDYQGIMRAMISNVWNVIAGKRLEGGSTITQQVAKNFLLSNERSIKRKVKEALLATRIEKAFSKREIVELYLNEIYLGWRSYGVAAAALNYFGKSLSEVTVAEAAFLAALPKAPNNYRPDRPETRKRALARRNAILKLMANNDYITPQQAEASRQEELVVRDRPAGAQHPESEYFAEEVRRLVAERFGDEALYNGGLSVRATIEPRLQKAAMKALRAGLVAYDQRHGWRGPVARIEINQAWAEALDKVDSNSDLDPWRLAAVLQVNSNRQLVKVGFEGGRHAGYIPFKEMEWARPYVENEDGEPSLGPKPERVSDVLKPGDVVYVEPVMVKGKIHHWALRQVPKANGAIIAMDPHTGRVLAMVGGFSFAASEFNRAIQAKRQPGSSFKPFVYAAALDSGYTPASLILDAPFVLDQGEDQPLWKPDNYVKRFYGPSTLRLGIEKSRNLMTVRLAHDVGMRKITNYAERFGVVEEMPPVLSMALGAGETTLMRMVTAYSMMVNGGKRVSPIFIDRIQDREGKTVFRTDQRECEKCDVEEWKGQKAPILEDNRKQVIDPRTAYQVVSLLEGVVKRGTARRVQAVGKPVAGKTGTTNDYRDAWFVGFSPDLAAGVYVGFDQPQSLGNKESGGRVAAPIFRDFMKEALKNAPATPFRTPSGIRFMKVNGQTGLRAKPGDSNVIVEAFKAGSEPSNDTKKVLGGGEVAASDESGDARNKDTVGGLY